LHLSINTEQPLRVFRLLFVAIYWEHQYTVYATRRPALVNSFDKL